MTKSTLALRATVTRRQPVLEAVDQAERLLQAAHHEAAETAILAANEARTTVQPEPAVPKPRGELQSAFLAGNLGKPVTAFTINGVRLTGRLKQFDQYCLLLEGPAPILLFKHTLSTITPAR